jgi:hypothetical protein
VIILLISVISQRPGLLLTGVQVLMNEFVGVPARQSRDKFDESDKSDEFDEYHISFFLTIFQKNQFSIKLNYKLCTFC